MKRQGGPALLHGAYADGEPERFSRVDIRVTLVTRTAKREAVLSMAVDIPGAHRVTIGADKGYDCKEYVNDLCSLTITPYVAQKVKGCAIDGRTIRQEGNTASQKQRKRVKKIFGRMKTVDWLRKAKYKAAKKLDWLFTLLAAAYNLVRMRNLRVVLSWLLDNSSSRRMENPSTVKMHEVL